MAGIDLGYRFEWDLYGPFSKGLAADLSLYAADRDTIDVKVAEVRVSQKAGETFSRMMESMNAPPPAAGQPGVSKVLWLEILASIHHIAGSLFKVSSVSEIGSDLREEILKTLFSRKPHLLKLRDTCIEGIESLKSIEGLREETPS